MGHVDHGKTSLLDVIRHSKLTSQEHGGITQHTGAYQIEHKGQKITFIDTPGHAAFAKMRARGAELTDLVVLVVAANDGVKPQTKESLAHIKLAKVPFMVAINKMDLPDADPNMVKAQLAENDVLVEGYGGQVVCVEVSARSKKGIDELLEMINLILQMDELKYLPDDPLEAIVIESSMDQRIGPSATVIVKKGTLKVGQEIIAGKVSGKVKTILSDLGKPIKMIKPGDPGRILGFKDIVEVGSIVEERDRNKKEEKEEKEYKRPYKRIIKKEVEQEKENGAVLEEKKIKILLKADTQGTLEAIKNNLPTEIELVYGEVGEINESDILLAQSSGAQIIAFNLKDDKNIQNTAGLDGVGIRHYEIIYKLFEDLEKRVLIFLEPSINEVELGKGEIIAEFSIKKQHVAGCKVKSGEFIKNSFYKIKRGEKTIAEKLRMRSMQKERQLVEKASTGSELGLVFRPDVDFLIGDVIISYNLSK